MNYISSSFRPAPAGAAARIRLESLEDRALPSGVEWLARFDGLPGETREGQMEAVEQMLEAAQIAEEDVEVVDHATLDGNIVIETPEDTDPDILRDELATLPGFLDVQPFEGEESESAIAEAPDGTGPVQLDPGPAGGPNLNVGLVGNEPTIAVNPLNPNNVAVAQFNNGSQTLKLSLDGGATFPITRNAVLAAGQSFFQGDDSLAFDAQGRLFWTYLSGGTPSGPNVTAVQISPTTGAVIGSPVLVATSNLDKEWLAADRTPSSPFANNLYVVWHDFNQTNAPVRFARSTNQGVTWTTLAGNLSAAGEGFTWPSEVAVGPNGNVWAAWHTNTIGNGSNGEVRMRRSTDGGATFGPELVPFPAGTADAQVNAGSAEYGPPVPPRINKLKSWLQGSLQPRILVDPARPGNIYVISVDDPDNVYDATGDPSDIVLARSTDNGATWTRSTISHGAPGTIQVMPAAAIDGSGNLTVTWYDNRGGATNAAGDWLLDVYATTSFDGGLTFGGDTRINDASFNPDLGAPDRFSPNQVLRIGEYNGLASAGGTVYAVWTGNSGSGQQVVFGKFTLAYAVVASTPAAGQMVTTAPADFVVQFSGAVAPASVQPTDLTVNGVPAASVAVNAAGDTLTFHYAVSPVTTEGPQSMAIAAGAIIRLSDSAPVAAFSAAFLYDPQPLTVTTTSPAAPNGVFTLPAPLTYDVTFNEPFDPASVQAADLALSGIAGATVTGVTVLPGNTTARFTIGVAAEGTLTASLPAGVLTDASGNPNLAFSAGYPVDITIAPYPTPLTPKSPPGSLVYDPSAPGIVSFSGDTDTFTLGVDPGQTIAVSVSPAAPTLFGGVGNAGINPGSLLVVNPTTGAGTFLADPATPGGLSGLAYDPSAGVLFGSTVRNVTNTSTLVRLDPDTGATLSTVGPITAGPGGPAMSIGDLALQPGTNTLFGVRSSADGTGNAGRLYTINKATGVATLVGSTGSGAGGGIAFAPDGTLYQTAFNGPGEYPSLNRLDPATAARLSTVPVAAYYDGLAVRPTDGVLFAATGGSNDQIFTINPSNGLATLVGSTGAGSTSDLDFRPPGLIPTVQVLDPSGASLGTAIAAGPGQAAVLQAVPAAIGGTYKVVVGGAAGTPGTYIAQLTLNAALEAEGAPTGPTNDTSATAQDLTPSLLTLQTPQATAQRGAVLGGNNLAPSVPVTTFDFTTGDAGFAVNNTPPAGAAAGLWHLSTGRGSQPGHSATQSFYYGQAEGPAGGGNYATGTLRNTGSITSPAIVVPAGATLNFNYLLQTEVSTSVDTATALVSTNNFATSTTVASRSTNLPNSTVWRAVAPISLAAFAGQTVQIRFVFDTVNGTSNTSEGWYVDDVQVKAPGTWTDYYALPLGAGESATVALKNLTGSGTGVSIENGLGVTLATGVAGPANFDRVVGNFTAPAAGTYYVRVNGTPAATYSLMATRNAAFDTEANDSFATAQAVGGGPGVLGAIAGSSTPLTLNAIDSGWWDATGFHDATNKNYIAGLGGGLERRDYFVYNLTGITQTIAGAQLNLLNPTGGYVSTDPTETYTVFDVSTPVGPVQATAFGQTAIFADLGTGTSFGAQAVSAATVNQPVPITLNAAGVAALNAARGTLAAVGGAVTTINGTADQFVFGFTGLGEVRQLALSLIEGGDWYLVNVPAGAGPLRLETATPADGPGQFANTLNPHLDLFDPVGNPVAAGVATADGRNESIQYQPLVSGPYRVRVTSEGGTTGEYFLTRNFAPAVTGLSVAPLNEGDAANLTGTFSDPDALDGHTVLIDWGPGEGTTTLNLPAGVSSFNATHPYPDDNPSGTPADAYPVSATITDDHGASGSGSTSVTVRNVAPSAVTLNSGAIDEDGTYTLSGTFTDPGTQDTHTVLIDWGPGEGTTSVDLPAGVTSFSAFHQYLDDNPTATPADDYPVSATVTDDDTGVGGGTATVTVRNVAPTVTGVSPAGTITEDGTFSVSGSFADPGTQDTHTVVINWGPGEGATTLALPAGVFTFGASHHYLDDNPSGTASDTYPVTVTVTDDDGGSGSAGTAVTVNNAAPAAAAVVTPVDPVAAGSPSPVNVSAAFTDAGTLDTHTAAWDWGDGTTTVVPATEAGGSGVVTGAHGYLTPGVYTVTLTLTDDDGGVAVLKSGYVVVYDPSAGFATGGGWIDSPAGAYVANPTLSGKATFGFVSSYKNGTSVPDGNTQFLFHEAGFDFRSTSYDWLVVAGARAQYKGTGTVNGAGSYGFLLTAIDGQRAGGGGVDRFRIKVWDKATGLVVYDNQMGKSDTADPTTALAGGSIQIHDNGK